MEYPSNIEARRSLCRVSTLPRFALSPLLLAAPAPVRAESIGIVLVLFVALADHGVVVVEAVPWKERA